LKRSTKAWQTLQTKKLGALVVELLSCHVWAFSSYSERLPELHAGIWHPDQDVAKSLLSTVRERWEIIVRAENLVFCKEPQPLETSIAIRKCLDGIGFNNSAAVREWAQMATDAKWDHEDKDLRTSAFAQWGGVENTQEILESTFQETREQTRQSRNSKMTCLRAQHHLSLAPRLRGSSVNTLELTQQDWLRDLGTIDYEALTDAPFTSGTHEMRRALKDRRESVPIFKQATGLAAERRSVSAISALVKCSVDDVFVGLNHCWLSMLLGGAFSLQVHRHWNGIHVPRCKRMGSPSLGYGGR
jgi:hypothetical protein